MVMANFNNREHEICSGCGCVVGHGCPKSEPCDCEDLLFEKLKHDFKEGHGYQAIPIKRWHIYLKSDSGIHLTHPPLDNEGRYEYDTWVIESPELAAEIGMELILAASRWKKNQKYESIEL